MEFVFDALKIVALVFIWQMFLQPIALKLYYYPKFQSLCRKYEAKFKLLTTDEKIQVLEATAALHIRSINDDIDYTLNNEQGEVQSILMDSHYSGIEHVLKNTPNFEKLSPIDLEIEFKKELLKHWEAMVFAEDYDFEGTIVELDEIFNRRVEFSELVRKEKKSVSNI